MAENTENKNEISEKTLPAGTKNEQKNDNEMDRPDAIGEDTEVQELTKLLEQYSTGDYTIDITRRAPLFCAGYCGTVPVDGTSLQDIRATWGGERFHFKFTNLKGQIVARRNARIADVPRNNGIPIDPESWGRYLASLPAANQQNPAGAPAFVPENPYLTVLRDTLDRQTELIERLLSERIPQPSGTPVGELLETVMKLKEVSGIFGSSGPAASGDPMMEMLKMFMENKMKDDRRRPGGPPQFPRRLPPRRFPDPVRTIPAPADPRASSGDPAKAPEPAKSADPAAIGSASSCLDNYTGVPADPAIVGGHVEDDEETIVKKFAALPVENMAKNVGKLFENLSDEDKQKALEVMMKEMNP